MKTLIELKSKEIQYKKLKTKNLVVVEQTINEGYNLPNKQKVVNTMEVLKGYLLDWRSNVQVQDEANDLIDAIDKLKGRIK